MTDREAYDRWVRLDREMTAARRHGLEGECAPHVALQFLQSRYQEAAKEVERRGLVKFTLPITDWVKLGVRKLDAS